MQAAADIVHNLQTVEKPDDLWKPLIGALAPVAVSFVSYWILYLFGFNRAKQESQTIELISKRLDLVERLAKIGVSDLERFQRLQYYRIEMMVKRAIEFHHPNMKFLSIRKKPWYLKVWILPSPRGAFTFIISALYYYLALFSILWTMFVAAGVVMDLADHTANEDDVTVAIVTVVGLPLLAGLGLALRYASFHLRCRHEQRRAEQHPELEAAMLAA